MYVYLDTANLIDIIDGRVDAASFISKEGITWCISDTTMDDLVGQRLGQKLAILNLLSRLPRPLLKFKSGPTLLAVELGSFVRKKLDLPATAREPLAYFVTIRSPLEAGPETPAEPLELQEQSVEDAAVAHDIVDAERKQQKDQMAIAHALSKFASQPRSKEVQDAVAAACNDPACISEIARDYFEAHRRVAAGAFIPTDEELAIAIAEERLPPAGMTLDGFLAGVRLNRALRDGDTRSYFTLAKELSRHMPTSGPIADIASNFPKDPRLSWALRLLFVNSPPDVRSALLANVKKARQLAQEWLNAEYETAPGSCVYREATYQFERDARLVPIPSTSNDYYHLVALPHVDLMFVDAQTQTYVSRARFVPLEVKQRAVRNATFKQFVLDAPASGEASA